MNSYYQKIIRLWAGNLAQDMKGNKEDNQAVMAYGLFVILFNTAAALVTVLVGAVLGTFSATALTFLTSGSLRLFTGGYHCSSPIKCLLLTIGIFNFLGLCSVFLTDYLGTNLVIGLVLITMVLSFLFILKFAPLEAPNKPIKPALKPGLRKMGLGVWFFWAVVLIILMVLNLNDNKQTILAIQLGIAYQTFSILSLLKNKNQGG